MTSRPAVASAPNRRDLVAFLLLAVGLTWVFWIPMALGQRALIDLPVPALALTVVGSFGPMAAALLLAARRHGAAGARALFGQLRLRGLDRRWLWIALATGLVDLSPVFVFLARGGQPPEGVLGQVLAMPLQFVFVAVVGGGLDEEMGWRGFALPGLQRLIAPLPANLVLGVVWSLWHLPLFFDPTSSHAAMPFAVYLATVTAQALVIGWLYNASGGSLLVAIVAHSAHNTADGLRLAVVDHASGELLQLVAYLLAALAVVVLTRGRLGLPAPSPSVEVARPVGSPAT